jgi:hypothetical protein
VHSYCTYSVARVYLVCVMFLLCIGLVLCVLVLYSVALVYCDCGVLVVYSSARVNIQLHLVCILGVLHLSWVIPSAGLLI